MTRVADLLASAVRRAENGGDGSALTLLGSAVLEAVAMRDDALVTALRRVEATASAGMSDQACALDDALEQWPLLDDATLAAAVQKLGVWVEGLWASEERIPFLRRKAAARAGCSAPLALALTASARGLARAGSFSLAAERCEEALLLWRQLGSDHDKAFARRFAETLCLLGAVEAERGNLEGACAALEESCRLLSSLEQIEPELCRPTLASAWHNLAGARTKRGDGAGALQACRKAIHLRHALAEAASSIYALDLAHTLSQASHIFFDQREVEQAGLLSRQAADIFRGASRADHAYLLPLALALRAYSHQAVSVGRLSLALEAADEEIAIYRSRLRLDGDAAATALAGALHNRAVVLALLNRDEEAFASASEGIDLRRKLDVEDARADVVASLRLAGAAAHRSGRAEIALDYLGDAVRILSTLRDGVSRAADEDYVRECIALSDAQCDFGRLRDAAESSAAASAVMSTFAGKGERPQDLAEYGRLLLRTGNLQRRAGLAVEAIASYERAASLPAGDDSLDPKFVRTAIRRLISCLKHEGRITEARRWAARLGDEHA